MSRGHILRQNNGLSRAIRSQAGSAAFPYPTYSAMAYGEVPAAPAAPSAGSVLLGVLGGVMGTLITAKNTEKTNAATLAYNERIEMARIEAEVRSRAAEAAALASVKTGGKGMTMTLIAGASILVGGGAYYVFRKRKAKARK